MDPFAPQRILLENSSVEEESPRPIKALIASTTSKVTYVYTYDMLPEDGVIGRGHGLQSRKKRVVLNLINEGNSC
ncbi:hypothetical protein PM082_013639 [Marasmius tenuissimus]|nr:hypothetical protein PM082_013639 [Marasmius tenuissimus]